jgi:hypothetical protein
MLEIDARHGFEKLPGEMLRRTIAGRSHVDFPGIGFCVGDEFRDASPWTRLRDDHDERKARKARDLGDVPQVVERDVLIEARIDRIRRNGPLERVAVGRRANDGLGSDIVACARPIFDDEALAKATGEPFGCDTRADVRGAPRREAYDDADRTRGVIKGQRGVRRGRRQTRRAGELEKKPPMQGHHKLPLSGQTSQIGAEVHGVRLAA